MQIWFYDVSASQELAHLNGQNLTFNELYEYHAHARPSWPPLEMSQSKYARMEFHPYNIDGDSWKSWIRYFSTTCRILSGHAPTKEEVKIIRELVRRLPNEFKRRHVDQHFVLGFMTYLCIGFKGHLHSGFGHDSNAAASLVEFMTSLYGQRRLLFTSFLCAHRDPQSKPGEPLNLLQSNIPPEKVRRSAALVLALAHNVSSEVRGSAIFLQQGVSFAATSSIFPEVSVEYFLHARAHEFLDRLACQYRLVRSVLEQLPGTRVRARLVSLDVLTRRIERFLLGRYGTDWRSLDFTHQTFGEDSIVQVAVEMGLPEIRRMMPFFSDNFQERFMIRKEEILHMNLEAIRAHGSQDTASQVRGVIEWFVQQHSMTISAKAVYETTFYYLWGRYCATHPGVYAIGFDRDHDRFQHFAWHLGRAAGIDKQTIEKTALLYARRNPTGHERGALADLSFRQFWRIET